jgi:hypothetical protein
MADSIKVPKRFQTFKGIKPEELFLYPANNRFCVGKKGKWKINFLTGAMKRENAEKLIEDYKHWYNENPSHS